MGAWDIVVGLAIAFMFLACCSWCGATRDRLDRIEKAQEACGFPMVILNKDDDRAVNVISGRTPDGGMHALVQPLYRLPDGGWTP